MDNYLLREDDSYACRILSRIDGSLVEKLCFETRRQATNGTAASTTEMSLTPSAKRAIELAHDESWRRNQNYIGTEHLLLGLIRGEEGLAGRVLVDAGVTAQRVREQIAIMEKEVRPQSSPSSATSSPKARTGANAALNLTDRELDVLLLIADGQANATIAERLGISAKTVKSHVGNILSKLNLTDRTQAAVYAWRSGLAARSDAA